MRFSPYQYRDFRKRPSPIRRFPTIFRTLPNVPRNFRRCWDDVWALPKLFGRPQFSLVLISLGHKVIIRRLFGTFSWKLNWIFVKSCIKETICPDLWVKSSLMREIEFFIPQPWDSRIMREGWQVYKLYKFLCVWLVKFAVQLIRFWNINSLRQRDQRQKVHFYRPFFLQGFLSLSSAGLKSTVRQKLLSCN